MLQHGHPDSCLINPSITRISDFIINSSPKKSQLIQLWLAIDELPLSSSELKLYNQLCLSDEGRSILSQRHEKPWGRLINKSESSLEKLVDISLQAELERFVTNREHFPSQDVEFALSALIRLEDANTLPFKDEDWQRDD